MKKFIIMTVMLLLVAGFQVSSGALTADEIINKANEVAYYQADDGRANIHMVITDSLGRTRGRNMTIIRMDGPDNIEQKYYVYFEKPDDVKDMTYLVWKHPGKDDDRWMYLPALDLIRRIASSDKRSSFVGSNFAYEDVSGRGSEEDIHTLEGEENSMYKIKNVPKDPGSVEFSYYITWINKDDFIPKKGEYYDKNGKLYKIIEAVEVKNIQGFPTITKMKATDLNSNGNTVSEFSDIKYNIGLKDTIFSERYLRRPPKQYLEQ